MNGNGELTGSHWIEEAGMLSLPIGVTNSHAVGTVHRGIVDWVVARRPDLAREWLLPVAAETYDGDLNDINGPHVTADHVVAALDGATSGRPAEGSVGGGTGMSCYQFKGGNGTASRTVRYGDDGYTVGVLVQANFGARDELTVAGVPVGRGLVVDNPFLASDARPPGGGSVIVLVATDAPLLPGQCKALARRVPLGLARTGTTGSHFSGDIFLAFSTANAGCLTSGERGRRDGAGYDVLRFLPWPQINPLCAAVVQATEEAVVNALVAADTMTGRNGFTSPGIPVDQLVGLLRQAGRT
jgi:L-aminopeptidase/D-esterase-like protein